MHTKNISMKNCEVWTELSKYSQWYANNFFSSHKWAKPVLNQYSSRGLWYLVLINCFLSRSYLRACQLRWWRGRRGQISNWTCVYFPTNKKKTTLTKPYYYSNKAKRQRQAAGRQAVAKHIELNKYEKYSWNYANYMCVRKSWKNNKFYFYFMSEPLSVFWRQLR